MSAAKIMWQAAFVAFCNGVPLDEISQVFDIPMHTLRGRMTDEGWEGLRTKLPLVTNSGSMGMQGSAEAGLPAKTAARLELVEANRAENLKVFTMLREHLVETVIALRDGKMKLEKQFHNKGQVVRAECPPGPADWVNISTYARQVADGTYRALGDFQGQEKPGQDAGAGATNAPQPSITIILPTAIAQPREERQITDAKSSQVIDLRPVTEQSSSK